MRALLIAMLSVDLLCAQAPAEKERVPVLAELFTAEGCNSCPPADRILETLMKEQPVTGVYIVGLSEHVTYWDQQGWRDPFGSAQMTQRQTAYGWRFKLESIYTPQVIVDGSAQMVGSDLAALKQTLTDAAGKPKPRLLVDAKLTPDGKLAGSVSGPGMSFDASEGAELHWAISEDNLVVDVKRGENANRTLHHSGVVRALNVSKLDHPGLVGGVVLPLKPEWKRENLRLVAFVQSIKSRRVFSVGWAPVPSAR